ncbi:dehydrogenase [Candidatus Poribacteria bacterium]|nr:dehydrogenase [Candidatus Poribacteria bacterium]
MKAAILVQSKQPLEVVDIHLPNELDYGQVLVDLHYSGICGAQLNEIEAVKGPDPYLPHLLGHEGSGVVLGVGAGVSSVEVGDHVVLHWRPGKGLQSLTPKYDLRGKTINAGWVTTFNEKAVVSENRVTRIPKDIDLRIATLFGCSVTTAFGVINNDAQVKIGQSVVVFGLGGVGLNIVQAANIVAAHPIIGVDLTQSKLDLGTKYGLTQGMLVDSDYLNEKILEIVGRNGADVVIDTTGIGAVIEQAYELTHPDGKTILVGVPNRKISIYTLPLHFNKVIKGSHGGDSQPDLDIPRYIKLLKTGKIKFDGIITHEFLLEDINEALNVFRNRNAGRILINLNSE